MAQLPAPHQPDVIRLAAISDELAAVREAWAPDALDVEEIEIAPRSDIAV
ncbi:MAG TPA: hypothetical protein VLA33_01955 [Gemmatimonadota bacterium]|nr:hypothetical protein [Gemmatimonadota bacterium]